MTSISQLPGQSLESVEMLANPFAAEYGRFSTSVMQIRTRRGTNDWEIKPGNLMPRFRKGFNGVRGFEPRFSVRGPLRSEPDLPRAGFSVSLRQRPGEEPARRAGHRAQELRFVHPHRQRALAAAYAGRAHRHLSPRDRPSHDEHVPAARGDAEVQPERHFDRRAGSLCALADAWCWKRRSRDDGSRSTSTPTAASR